MADKAQITQALYRSLPEEFHTAVPQLSQQIMDALENKEGLSSPGPPFPREVLEALQGQILRVEDTVVRFGAGSNLGDVSIRDISGRDVITFNMPITVVPPSRNQRIREERSIVIFGLELFKLVIVRTIEILTLGAILSLVGIAGFIGTIGLLPNLDVTIVPTSIEDVSPTVFTDGAVRATPTLEAALTAIASTFTPENATSTPVIGLEAVNLGNYSQETNEGALLTQFFALQDVNGKPLLRDEANFSNAQIAIIDASGSNIPLTPTIFSPESNILLLLDGTRSMNQHQNIVEEGTISAIEALSSDVSLSIYQFGDNRSIQQLTNFTNDKEVLIRAVRSLNTTATSTCLYDSIYLALDSFAFEETDTQALPSIVVVTDGRDETPEGLPCSYRSINDVISKSISAQIPIYVIGICADPGCSSVNLESLIEIGRESNGMHVIGSTSWFRESMQLIFQAINSRWGAQAIIPSGPGRQNGVLFLEMSDGSSLSMAFQFFSNRDYRQESRYSLSIPSTNQSGVIVQAQIDPEQELRNIVITLRSEQNEVLWKGDFDSASLLKPFEIRNKELISRKNYCVTMQAYDTLGNLVALQNGLTILAEKCFTYTPPLTFAIKSTEFNQQDGTLAIDLDIQGNTSSTQLPEFTVRVATREGRTMAIVDTTLTNSKRLVVSLPPRVMQQGEYILIVALKDTSSTISDKAELVVNAGYLWRWYILIGISVLAALLLVTLYLKRFRFRVTLESRER